MNRRLGVVLAALSAAALMVGTPAAAQEEEKLLNLDNWSNYIGEDTPRNFESETGIRVRRQLPEGIFLELVVKVEKDWQRRPDSITRLGF